MSDLISRAEAIKALGEEPEVWTGKDEYAQGLNNQWHYDVNAIKALPSAQPEPDEGCHDCKEYDQDNHCCHRWTKVIRRTVEELNEAVPMLKKGKWIAKDERWHCSVCNSTSPKGYRYNFCPNCGADMRGENK